MKDRLNFLRNRLAERLWFRPLVTCIFSIVLVFLASRADRISFALPIDLTQDSLETLLQLLAASMLVIATFAVASMVSAYASASSTATPRAFALIVADDTSQNALSTFVGAFIFSVVGLIAVMNDLYDVGGRLALFMVTLAVFALVVATFVRWVDRIARLGRIGVTIGQVEVATAAALEQRRARPQLGGMPASAPSSDALAVFADEVGYVQRVELAALQSVAEERGVRLRVSALPGTFSAPGRALAHLLSGAAELSEEDADAVRAAFNIGRTRTFDDDPRFGLIALAEIACRALSPAVNDPGTAIEVIGTFVRLLCEWRRPDESVEPHEPEFPLLEVEGLALGDLMDDAFRPIARDGAALVEVGIRLQRAFGSLAALDDEELRTLANAHARSALARAEEAMSMVSDLDALRAAAPRIEG